jgi:hypothetical protein
MAMAMLAGCGGSQPPIRAPGAMPQAAAIAAHTDRGTSWMLPEAKSEDLLYVSNYANGTVTVYSHKAGKLVGTLSGLRLPTGLCTNKRGDVFIANLGTAQIFEYAHGGVKPINTLSLPGYDPEPYDCSVDKMTGNLAVTENQPDARASLLVIFQDASGTPATYAVPDITNYRSCTYDNKGNLFVAGEHDTSTLVLDELLNGSGKAETVRLNRRIDDPGGLQWDGRYVAAGDQRGTIYRFMVSNRIGTSEGITKVRSARKLRLFWIEGSTLIGANLKVRQNSPTRVMFWSYPGGGSPLRAVTRDLSYPYGVTVSVAPK